MVREFFGCCVGIVVAYLPSLPVLLETAEAAFIFKRGISDMGDCLWLLSESPI